MRRERQAELLEKFFDMQKNRLAPMAESVYRMPAARYVDVDVAADERRGLFRGRPLLVGLSADVPRPGDYLAIDIANLPVVVVRGEDGLVRALVNVCRHRAAPVFDGRGHTDRRAVTCPFHAWVYDLDGRLLGQPQSNGGFAGCERAGLGLPVLAVVERHGMIFVAPTERGENASIDADPIGAAADDLADLRLAGYRYVDSRTRTIDANWKLVMDSFLEAYHIRSLHSASIGPYYFSTPSVFECLGEVALLIGIRSTVEDVRALPPEERTLLPHATIQYVLPPSGLVVHQLDHVETWTVWPGARPEESVVTTSVYVPPGSDDTDVQRAGRNLERLLGVTDVEDFGQAARIQRALAGGALPELLFGRNEPALVHFHQVLDRAFDRRGV